MNKTVKSTYRVVFAQRFLQQGTLKALTYTSKVSDGSFSIKEITKYDPRLSLAGTKSSGYNRELSMEGIHELTNKRVVFVK